MARLREASRQPLRAVFRTRALHALVDLSALLPEREVGEISQAPSDYAVLLRGLEMPEATETLRLSVPRRLLGIQELYVSVAGCARPESGRPGRGDATVPVHPRHRSQGKTMWRGTGVAHDGLLAGTLC